MVHFSEIEVGNIAGTAGGRTTAATDTTVKRGLCLQYFPNNIEVIRIEVDTAFFVDAESPVIFHFQIG